MSNDSLIKAEKSNEGITLTLTGDLSVNCMSALKEEFNFYCDNQEPIHVIAKDVESIDITIYQLLQSFIWTRKQNKRTTNVNITLTPDQQLLINNCGITLRS